MFLQLYRLNHAEQTLYNVIQMSSDSEHRLSVKNKQDGSIQFQTYEFKKDYDWFKVSVN